MGRYRPFFVCTAVLRVVLRKAHAGALRGGPRLVVSTTRMIGFEGRLQWRRHKLFKLRAKRVQRKKYIAYK
jgi:hypothetical protein